MKIAKHKPLQCWDNKNKFRATTQRKRDRRTRTLHDKCVDLMISHGVSSAPWRRVARRYYRIKLVEQMEHPINSVITLTRRRSRI